MKKLSTSLFSWILYGTCSVIWLSSCAQKSVQTKPVDSLPQKSSQQEGLKLRSGEFSNLKSEDLLDYKITTDTPFTHFLFGYIDPEDPEATFQVASDVPFKVGMYYGWALKLSDGAGSNVKIEEVLTLPQPARVFRIHSGRSKVSEDGTEVKSTLNITAEDGWLFNFWQLTLGDPEGNYQMSLSYNAQSIVDFQFKVAR